MNRRWTGCLLLVVVASVASVASGATLSPRQAKLHEAITELGLDPAEVATPLRLTEEMKAWAAGVISTNLPAEERMLRLLNSLLLKQGLGLDYEIGFTGTAQEVFDSGVANCLGFTQLFVALSREVGVDTYYLAVSQLTSFKRENDLIIVSDHVTAAYDDVGARRVLEFSLAGDFDYRSARELSDLTALALYYSNRGAEEVQSGDHAEGRRVLEIAVALAPRMAQAWVNLGVARRRLGDLEGAEAAYQQALELDPGQLSAYHNLIGLYHLQGRSDPAGEILAKLDRRDNKNPFIYLELADANRKRGAVSEARRLYRRAITLGREHAETHAAYGMWHLESGDHKSARKLLRRAEKIDPDEARTVILRERLAVGG